MMFKPNNDKMSQMTSEDESKWQRRCRTGKHRDRQKSSYFWTRMLFIDDCLTGYSGLDKGARNNHIWLSLVQKERLAMINMISSFSSDVSRENKPFQGTSLFLSCLKTSSSIWQSRNNKLQTAGTVSGDLSTANKTSNDALELSYVKVGDNELVALSKLMNDDICIKKRWIKMPCHWSPSSIHM